MVTSSQMRRWVLILEQLSIEDLDLEDWADFTAVREEMRQAELDLLREDAK